MDCSLRGSSVHGIFQATVLEWTSISFSRGSSWPRDRIWVSHIVDRHFTVWATREVLSGMWLLRTVTGDTSLRPWWATLSLQMLPFLGAFFLSAHRHPLTSSALKQFHPISVSPLAAALSPSNVRRKTSCQNIGKKREDQRQFPINLQSSRGLQRDRKTLGCHPALFFVFEKLLHFNQPSKIYWSNQKFRERWESLGKHQLLEEDSVTLLVTHTTYSLEEFYLLKWVSDICFSPQSQKELPDQMFRLVLLLDESLTVLVH